MRGALAFVGVGLAAACGAGATTPSDAGTPDAATVGSARFSWVVMIDGAQGECEEGWTVRLRTGPTQQPSTPHDVPCEQAALVVEGLAPGDWYAQLFLLDANGDVLGASYFRSFSVVAGESVDVTTFIIPTTREPDWPLQDIAEHAILYYETNGTLPASGEYTPLIASCCAVVGGICWPMPSEWDEEPWNSLGYHHLRYHRFYYRFLREVDGFVVQGTHDSDCDNEYSLYELRGAIDQTTGMIELGEITMTIEQNDFP